MPSDLDKAIEIYEKYKLKRWVAPDYVHEILLAAAKTNQQLQRDMQLLLAELEGVYTGLMMHPSDTPCNGCLISEASKEKLNSISKLIKRYEQL